MDRRAFLGTASVSLVGLTAGCFGDGEDDLLDDENSVLGEDDDGEDDEIVYERCNAEFVPVEELPPMPRYEVETALEEGAYATDETLVYPEIVRDDATLWDKSENRYYEHDIEGDDSSGGADETTLTFEEVSSSVNSTGDLLVSNQTTDELEVSVTISPEDDDPVVEETVSADPADDIDEINEIKSGAAPGDEDDAQALPGVAFPTELGDYEVTVEVDEWIETEVVSVTPWFAYYWVQVTEDDLLVGDVGVRDEFFAEMVTSKAGIHAECDKPMIGWPKAEEE